MKPGLDRPEDFLKYDDPIGRLAYEFILDVEAYLGRVARWHAWLEQEGRL